MPRPRAPILLNGHLGGVALAFGVALACLTTPAAAGPPLPAAVQGLTLRLASAVPNLNPRVLGLMKSRRPEREWHSGELETALMLTRAPRLVRRDVARRLPSVWVDVHAKLRRGARRFEQLDGSGRGYFGSPAVARAATGESVLRLRGRLIARDVVAALSAGRPRGRSGRSAR